MESEPGLRVLACVTRLLRSSGLLMVGERNRPEAAKKSGLAAHTEVGDFQYDGPWGVPAQASKLLTLDRDQSHGWPIMLVQTEGGNSHGFRLRLEENDARSRQRFAGRHHAPGDELSFALGKARFPGGAFDASSRTQAMPVENVDDRDDDGNDYNEKEAGDDADAHHRQPCRNQ